MPRPERMPQYIGGLFLLIGLVLLAFAGWSGYRQHTIIKSWPEVQAEVVKSELVDSRDDDGKTMYSTAIEFRYTAGGKEFSTPTKSNYSTSSYEEMKTEVDAYAPGTRHAIRINPSNPRDIQYNAGYTPGFFLLSIVLGAMGVVFSGLSIVLLLAFRPQRSISCPSCGNAVEPGQNFCPNCAAPLRGR
ncbi:MAG: DUF3592 domain-containing protein [Terriglobia bacterium]